MTIWCTFYEQPSIFWGMLGKSFISSHWNLVVHETHLWGRDDLCKCERAQANVMTAGVLLICLCSHCKVPTYMRWLACGHNLKLNKKIRICLLLLNKVDVLNLVTYLNQKPILEWHVVLCGFKNGYQRLLKKDWIACSKFYNHSKFIIVETYMTI